MTSLQNERLGKLFMSRSQTKVGWTAIDVDTNDTSVLCNNCAGVLGQCIDRNSMDCELTDTITVGMRFLCIVLRKTEREFF